MTGKIVYRFKESKNILYINLVARYSCTNDCVFCDRPKEGQVSLQQNVYESVPGELYLSKSPGIDEIFAALETELRPSDSEICIVGLGEPLLQFKKVSKLLRTIKFCASDRFTTRINTNGLVDCFHNNGKYSNAMELAISGLDAIKISVNAVNADDYAKLCRSHLKVPSEEIFDKLISFAQGCKENRIDTYLSFVTDFSNGEVSSRSAEDYLRFAASIGFEENHVILRKYIAPPQSF